MALIQDLNTNDGVTIALVTHEPEVAAATRRIVTLRDGKILSDERIEQLPVSATGNASLTEAARP